MITAFDSLNDCAFGFELPKRGSLCQGLQFVLGGQILRNIRLLRVQSLRYLGDAVFGQRIDRLFNKSIFRDNLLESYEKADRSIATGG